MRTIFCQKIEWILSSFIQSISETTITPITGQTVQNLLSESHIVVDETQKIKNGIDFWQQKLTIKTTTFDLDYANTQNPVLAVLKLYTNNNEIKLMGSIENPAQIIINKNDGIYTVEVLRESDSML